jgi:2'-hydroxyisoflavone reductase
MKLLVLGGTVFLGRHLVESALERGHEVNLFNRGLRNPDLFPQVERLRGNRDGNLEALKGRSWDAVLDTSGFVPRIVSASADLLAPATGLYVFISTISVYGGFSQPHFDENAPLDKLDDETIEEITGESYGPLKALCEQAVRQALPDKSLIIRPGLIVGPHDLSDRFTYWPRRIAQGGEVLAPSNGSDPVQFIDVRDLAEWTIRMVEANRTGIYQATGPDYTLTTRAMLNQCVQTTGSGANLTWVDTKFLLEKGVQPWVDLPAWLPAEGETAFMQTADCRKALQAGLTFRPLPETILDTLSWLVTRPSGPELKTGLKADREKELLQEWHSQGHK